MIDARTFPSSLDKAKTVLENNQARLAGYYEISDKIYHNTDGIPLAEEFLRLRVVPVNIWDEAAVILALKRTTQKAIGKESTVPFKKFFDSEAKATDYYKSHLAASYDFDYSFSRVGWQYFLPNGEGVDLEIVEDTHPTIEFKAPTVQDLQRLLGLFAVRDSEVIKGPSVVAIKERLGR